jgi:RNA polymerase sigma factor FliA
MRGAMLDSLRSQDWVTRSDRTRAKAIRDAGQDRGASEAELAAATGMSVAEVRSTMAAVSARPVSIDAEPHDVADEADVESAAVVSEVLGAVSAVTRSLEPRTQVLLALRYYAGRPLAEAGAALGMEPGEAARAHARAILAIHDAMLNAVA